YAPKSRPRGLLKASFLSSTLVNTQIEGGL
ncbi:MAG: hypothetical protein ACJATS_002247, partial [Psychroserpens sp.]